MRVHPERAAEAQREVVIGGSAGRDGRSGNAGDAVLLQGRRQAVPVDQARLADPVFDAGRETPRLSASSAPAAVGLRDAAHRSGLAIDGGCRGARAAAPFAGRGLFVCSERARHGWQVSECGCGRARNGGQEKRASATASGLSQILGAEMASAACSDFRAPPGSVTADATFTENYTVWSLSDL